MPKPIENAQAAQRREVQQMQQQAGGRHGYCPVAVNKAIASSRQKIGGKEARLIHALLKGRG